jgi:CubicO group peptidase (beta-lactamase class C family)
MRLLSLIMMIAFAGACSQQQDSSQWSPAAIDEKARALMAQEDVKGMALALVENGEVKHVAAYGYRNVQREEPLEADTIMYGASLTKTAFAYMVLQLVDDGRFDLDRPLASYLPKPLEEYEDYLDIAEDERRNRLTARHVLTHSTGFHNFRWLEDDRKLRFHFEPGARYAYSGEGFYLLQLALEDGLGLDVKAEMQTRIYDRFHMPNTSMQWREDFAGNLADGYDMDGKFEPHDERSNVSAAGSMDTTIADQAKMWAGMVRGEGLSAESRAEFVRPQLAITTENQFPPLWETFDARGEEFSLSAGLGLVTYQGEHGLSWFKGGHNDWTGNFAVCQEETKRCLVMLSNSVRAELIYPELARAIMNDDAIPFWWDYGPVD